MLHPHRRCPQKPSIAVLPFANMSGDAEQEYFSERITEDIITNLSRNRIFFVISRSSSASLAARLQAEAAAGQVVIAAGARRLLGPSFVGMSGRSRCFAYCAKRRTRAVSPITRRDR